MAPCTALRILGLDLGSRRIGVAISDELGIAAHALRTLTRTGDRRDAEVVAALVAETGAAEIVVGWPLGTDGEEGPAAKRAARFAETLRARLKMPVHLQDERFSTATAEQFLIDADVSRKKRKAVIDQLAAANILREFMEARKDPTR
jgi:putative pre-16S rRNA nuclease